ncbi:MAG: hypothetical protein PHD96_01290 [Candidatus Pacebacteria bacterium]|nr:hypothetical protein [Candidatus Paceibacterota bacterium]
MPNYNINLITARRSYSVNEIASLLGIDRKTCGRWVKYDGLKVVEEGKRPILIMGTNLITFIKKRRAERKISLKENEYFCVKCHRAVRARMGSERTIKTGKRIGKDNREQWKKTAICDNCETQLNKFLGVYRRD